MSRDGPAGEDDPLGKSLGQVRPYGLCLRPGSLLYGLSSLRFFAIFYFFNA